MGTSKRSGQAGGVVDWLMEGDPAIRWQVMRDLLGRPAREWEAERKRVALEGWGKRLLELQDGEGTWGGGAYTPKWTSTTYTLLLLRDMGLATEGAKIGARRAVDLQLGRGGSEEFGERVRHEDLCVTGMLLTQLVHFGAGDERERPILEHLLAEQMPDGGWNCKRYQHQAHHSSVHTTMNVLDGLGDCLRYRRGGQAGRIREAVGRAVEFLLAHRLYKSDKTGRVIHGAFVKFSFPPRWHHDVLRALEFMRVHGVGRDPRLGDAIALVRERRRRDGRWPLENHHRGAEYFRMEKVGQASRWNTLRALRVLRWWEER